MIVRANTSVSSVPLQNLFSLFKMRRVLLSLKAEYAELGTSEEHRKKPESLD